MDYRGKELGLQFMYFMTYLRACMIPREHHANVFFTAAIVKLLCSVVCMVATLSELRLVLPEA